MESNLVIIPNTIEPYGYETIPILTYPNEFEYRFRFEEEWVDESLEHRLPELANQKGYIVLRDFNTGILYPIRYFQIKSASKIGKIYYYKIKLQGLIAYDSQNDHRQTQIADFNSEFIKFNSKYNFNNTPNENMRPLVFLTNFSCNIENKHRGSNTDAEMENWGNILSCFRDINFFKDVQFLRFTNIKPVDQNNGTAKFNDGTLELHEGADYEIEIAQFITKASEQLSPSDIKIQSDGQTVSVLRGVLRAVGKYDILTFIIRANQSPKSGATFLDILYLPKPSTTSCDDRNSSMTGDPRLSLPVKIIKNNRGVIQRVLYLVLFSCLYFFPSVLSLLPWPWLTSQGVFVKDFSLIGITTSLIFLISEIKRT